MLAIGCELSCITNPVGKNLKVLILVSLEFIPNVLGESLAQEIDHEFLPKLDF